MAFNPFQYNPFRRMPMGVTVDQPDSDFVSPYAGLAEYLLDRPVFNRGPRSDDPLASFRDRNDEKQAMRSVQMDFEGLEDQYQNLVEQFEAAKEASYENQRGADEEVKRVADEIARVEALIGPKIDPALLKEDLRQEILAGIPTPTEIDPDLLKEELRQDLMEAMPDQEALVAQIMADLPDDSVELQAMIDSLREELTGLIPDMPDIEALRAELMGLIPDAPDLEGLRSELMGLIPEAYDDTGLREELKGMIPEAQDLSPLEQQISDVMSRLDALEATPDEPAPAPAPAPDPAPTPDPVDYTGMSTSDILDSIGAPGVGDMTFDPFDQYTGQEPLIQSLAAQSAATEPAAISYSGPTSSSVDVTLPATSETIYDGPALSSTNVASPTLSFTPLPEEAEAFLPETVRATPSRRTTVGRDVGRGGRGGRFGRGGQGMYF